MALTTFDLAIAGASAPVFIQKTIGSADYDTVGITHSCAYSVGFPGAATVPSPGLAGEALTSWTGQIPLTAAGRIMAVTGVITNSAQPGEIMIADRLWQNSGVVSATATVQSLGTPVAIPSRDADGATAGRGVLAGIEITTAGNAGNITSTTISYTNSAGTAGRTGTLPAPGMPSTPSKGTFAIFSLQAGDVGVRSIESVTLGSSYGTAVLSLVLFRPVFITSELTINRGFHADCLSGAGAEIYANSCLWLIRKQSTTTGNIIRLMLHHTAGA